MQISSKAHTLFAFFDHEASSNPRLETIL